MLRWCINPIVGTGDSGDEYRGAVHDLANVNASSLIPTDQNGQPKYRFALSLVAAASMVAVSQVSNCYVFPDYPLDALMSGMDADARLGLTQTVEAYDWDGAGKHIDADHVDGESWRTVLNRIGQQIDPAFNCALVGVAEPNE